MCEPCRAHISSFEATALSSALSSKNFNRRSSVQRQTPDGSILLCAFCSSRLLHT